PVAGLEEQVVPVPGVARLLRAGRRERLRVEVDDEAARGAVEQVVQAAGRPRLVGQGERLGRVPDGEARARRTGRRGARGRHAPSTSRRRATCPSGSTPYST